jgi:DNA topoisomerase-1
MGKDLVIVESPAKARTVQRFLGDKYIALASMGHVRDLPRGKMGVDLEKGTFDPTYDIMDDKKKILTELRKAAKEADTVYLATDPDREGEAISWHLMEAIKIPKKKAKRVVFHEITRDAINEAFADPRDLDRDLIDAQQARRVLDRIVGYKLSPVLWGKVRRGLSAGRVQSVALRLVVDRESDINAFIPTEYWSIDADMSKRPQNGTESLFTASLHSIKKTKGRIVIPDKERSTEILNDLAGVDYVVDEVRKRETKSRPAAPFITSTLQQEAYRKLRFTARRTMAVAQQLYEGISIGDEQTGLITYMRTDSTNVAAQALTEASEYITKKYGPEYAPDKPRMYSKRVRGAQEAHEAIRPTSIMRDPESIRQHLSSEQARLYDLIWKRLVASQMNDALFDSTSVRIGAEGKTAAYEFRVNGSILKFPGFRALYMEDKDDSADGDDELGSTMPYLEKGEQLDLLKLTPQQHFTQPPPRFTEASLVKKLEEEGIGRPSTYAPTLSTLMDRYYVLKDQGRFTPTKLGIAVTGLLTQHFPDIMDVGFTARIESDLDEIAEGGKEWTPVLEKFYGPFGASVDKAMKEAERIPRDQIDEETDEICPDCARPMVIKSGRFGRFLSCSGFPDCKVSQPLLQRVGVECPDCGSDLVQRRARKGSKGRNKVFFGCSNYPTCTFASNARPLPQPCPECTGMLVVMGRTNCRCLSCEHKGPRPEAETAEAAV